MTRYARIRLVTAALFAVLIVGIATGSALLAGIGIDVETVLLIVALGLLSFGVLVMVLLFDSRRRHQLLRALRTRWATGRLFVRDHSADEEQRAEMRRRLEYALEGLRAATGADPAVVGAGPASGLLEDPGRANRANRDAARETTAHVTARARLREAAVDVAPVPAPDASPPRLSASRGVAQGAPLVRVSGARHTRGMCVAAARTRLMALRQVDRRATRRAGVIRWTARAVALLLVPALVAVRVLTSSSWFSQVWDGIGSRAALTVALVLWVAAAVWTFVVTQPESHRRLGTQTKAESHALRSVLAGEQLAVRLALGIPPSAAWGAVSLSNHFPADAAIPAVEVEEALALVEQMRRLGRRRHIRSARRQMAVLAVPVLTCLVPASMIILLL